jgi:hypothetical protein
MGFVTLMVYGKSRMSIFKSRYSMGRTPIGCFETFTVYGKTPIDRSLSSVQAMGETGLADYPVGSSGSGTRRPLGWLGVSIVFVFVALLLLGVIKTNAGLPLPGLSQDRMQAQFISLKRLSFRKFTGQ